MSAASKEEHIMSVLNDIRLSEVNGLYSNKRYVVFIYLLFFFPNIFLISSSMYVWCVCGNNF